MSEKHGPCDEYDHPIKPGDSYVDFTCRLIEGLCALWPTDARAETLREIAQSKMDEVWNVRYRALTPGHELADCLAFWNHVTFCYPSHGVYQVRAVFDKTLNPDGKPRRVTLAVMPQYAYGTWIQLNLNAQAN